MAKNILGASDICINEINSSSDRGIDTAREIIQQARYNPADGNVTVFILDEAQKMVNTFMNAILKIVEEPPEFVYFFFCTTEPSKIITTIRNRCTEIKFKALGIEELSEVVNRVLKLEKIKLSNEVVESIAEKAEGADADLAELVKGIFRPTSDGLLSQARVMGLFRLKIKHPRWAEAMDLIRESIESRRGKNILSVRTKASRDADWYAILLDISSVRSR
jgi:DNA polymerase-3 subunit gamma/tau